MYKKIGTYAQEVGVSEEKFTENLKNLGILKKDGTPKKKYINNGVFDDEGHIKAQMKFGEIVLEKINEKIRTFKK